VAARRERRSSYAYLVADPVMRRTSLGIVLICAIQNFGYYGIMTWLPTYLAKNIGLSLTKSSLWTAAARATAQNVLFGLGRGIGGFAPLVVALLAGSYGFATALAFLALIYIVDMFALLLIPDRRGAPSPSPC
jgi:cyanate permease